MSNENVQKTNGVAFKDTSIVEKICCFSWFFIQIAVMAFFMVGLCQVNGETVNVITFLNNIVDIFSLQWSMFYYYASSCAQGILYMVVLILLIKNLVRAITYWTNAEYRKTGMEEMFKGTFKLVIRYMLLSFAFNKISFTSYAQIAIVFMVIAFVVLEGLKVLTSKRVPSVLYLITRFAYAAIVCTLVIFIAMLLLRNSFENIWNGLSLIFGYMTGSSGDVIIQTIYAYIVKDVFYLILLFIFFAILDELSYGKTVLGVNEWKALLTVSAVFIGVDLIVYFTFIGKFEGNALEAVFNQLKTQSDIVSVLLFSIVGVLTGSYPIFKRYAPQKAVESIDNKEDEEDEDEEEIIVEPAQKVVEEASAQAEAQPAQPVSVETSAEESVETPAESEDTVSNGNAE